MNSSAMNQPLNLPINPPMNPEIHSPMNQGGNASLNPPMNQPASAPMNTPQNPAMHPGTNHRICMCGLIPYEFGTLMIGPPMMSAEGGHHHHHHHQHARNTDAPEDADADAEPDDADTRDPNHPGLHRIHAVAPYNTWTSLAEAKEAIQSHAHRFGISWIFHQKQRSVHGVNYLHVRCDRHGNPRERRTSGVVQRKGSTKKNGCPAAFVLKALDNTTPEGAWISKPGRDTDRPLLHNHPPATYPGGIAAARRAQVTPELIQDVTQHLELGFPPRKSAALLREKYPGCLLLPKDITNMRTRIRAGNMSVG